MLERTKILGLHMFFSQYDITFIFSSFGSRRITLAIHVLHSSSTPEGLTFGIYLMHMMVIALKNGFLKGSVIYVNQFLEVRWT